MGFFLTFVYSQWFVTPKYPSEDLTGKTIIITGSNAGLGLEAARHVARLNCTKLILAVRTVSKGEKARESILESTGRTDDCIEVWHFDATSNASVMDFAKRARSLERIDGVIENIGIGELDWAEDEGFERTLKVNVVSTFLLLLLLLPKLRQTAETYNTTTHVAVVTSEMFQIAKFPERTEVDLYSKLNDREHWEKTMWDRYPITKLMEVLFVRELVKHTQDTPVITLINPGLCWTEAGKDSSSILHKLILAVNRRLFGRTAEVGARSLVAGICAGPESHGKYMSDCENQAVEGWNTPEDLDVQKKVYEQTLAVLEKVAPGISQNI